MTQAHPIRYHVRNGDFGVIAGPDGYCDESLSVFDSPPAKRGLQALARQWDMFSFSIGSLADETDQGQNLDTGELWQLFARKLGIL